MKSLLIAVQETFPSDNCTVETSPHIAVDIVAINKTDWDIGFDRIKTEEPCDNNEDEGSNDEQSSSSENTN